MFKKSKLHFFTDCDFFGGCENMIAVLFNHPRIREKYEISISYRFSYVYTLGLKKRINILENNIYPLKLLTISSIYQINLNIVIIKLVVFIYNIFGIKYLFFIINSIILYYHFKNKRIDILHINNGGYPGAYGCNAAVFAAKMLQIRKIVYVVNNTPIPYKNISRIYDFPIDRYIAKKVDLFISGSKYVQSIIGKILKITKIRTENIPNAIVIRIPTETRQETLHRLNISDMNSRVIFGIIAVFEKRKGHLVLLQSLKLLYDDYHKKKCDRMPLLLIEGVGKLETQLRKYVADNNFKKYVRFIGKEKNIFNLLNVIDVLVLPSIHNEDFPNIILEAMSMEKTIIATRLAGITEQIIHMESGLIVQPNNTVQLKKAIRLCNENKELRYLLKKNAKNRYRELFSSEKVVSRYLSQYEKTLKKNCNYCC